MHILCCFFKVVQRAIWAAIFLHVKNILRAPFLPRAPPFYTAHARLTRLNVVNDERRISAGRRAAALYDSPKRMRELE